MMRLYLIFLSIVLLLVVTSPPANAVCSSSGLWPQPVSATFGPQSNEGRVVLVPGAFAIRQDTQKNSSIINSAMARCLSVIFPLTTGINTTHLQNLTVLAITIDRVNETLPPISDESYVLEIGTGGDARISSSSVWGALRGLETFAQLVQFHPRAMPQPAGGSTTATTPTTTTTGGSATSPLDSLSYYFIECVPLTITDSPKYKWRGVMVDSTRNFVSVNSLKNTLDVMSAVKMNVLHWRLSDAYSFPFFSQSLPNISRSSFAPSAAYSPDDVRLVVSLGLQRGIRVLPEIPLPGRTLSWRYAIPLLLNCSSSIGSSSSVSELLAEYVAMHPLLESTYDAIKALMLELATLFPDPYIHLGGDQTQFECWPDVILSPSVNTNNFTDVKQLLQYFHSRLADILTTELNGTRRTPAIWAEVAAQLPGSFPNDAVVHLWQNTSENAAAIVGTTPRLLVSSVGWNLGQPYRLGGAIDTSATPLLNLNSNRSAINSDDAPLLYPQILSAWPTVEDVYFNEPFVVQGTYLPPLRILGGELLVWGFDVNSNNWATVWHRLAAVAERLWVGPVPSLSDSSRPRFYLRLNEMNCRFARRGLPTVPVLPNTFCDVVTSDTSGGSPPAPPPQVRYVQYGQYRARHLALVGLCMGVFGIMIGATVTYCWNSVSARFSQHRTRMQRLRDRELD